MVSLPKDEAIKRLNLKISNPEAFEEDGVYLPSWTKFAANPIKAKGFWTRMLQAIFLGQHGWDELNIDLNWTPSQQRRTACGYDVLVWQYA